MALRKSKQSPVSSRQSTVNSRLSPDLEMSDAPYDLPDGWTWKGLGKVVEILDGKRIPVNLTEREKRKGKIPYYGATGQVGWIDDYLFDEELLLLGEDGAPFLDPDKHKAYIISGKSWVNNHAHVLKALNLTLNAYVCHYLNTFDYHDFVNGTTRLKLTQGAMREIPVPLPPLPEQRRIVAKIERLFAESRTARDALERVPALLKRFRQSVLAAAFRGQLTERDSNDEPASALLERIRAERRAKWEAGLRAKGKDQSKLMYEEPVPPDTSYLRELPEGWIWTTTTQVCGSVADGTHDTPKYVEHGIPLVTSKNLKEDGLDFTNIKHISIYDHNKIRFRSAIERGDVLFAMIGTIGNPVVVQTEIQFSAKNVGLFRKNESFLKSEFLRFWFMSWDFNRILEENFLKGTTQKFVPLEGLRRFPVPLAPLAEQRRIVARIEALFAQADAVERAVAIARQRAGKIDQAILSRAFRGEL